MLDCVTKVSENLYRAVPFLSEELRSFVLAATPMREAAKGFLAFTSSSQRLQFKAVTLSSIHHMHISFAVHDVFLSCSNQRPGVFNRLIWITLGIADFLRNILQRLEEHFGQSKHLVQMSSHLTYSKTISETQSSSRDPHVG